jgi:RsiW-degrading membrane proteinase PrsW (M82 family)
MANVAYARRKDVTAETASPANGPQSLGAMEFATGGTPDSQSAVTSGLKVIVAYIPTEVITLYVAVLAAIQHPLAGLRSNSPELKSMWIAYYVFLACTPLVVWLVYAAKVRAANKNLPVSPRTWPLWEMFAATVAFTAWAFALPNTPFQVESWYSSAIAGVVVLVISTLLGLLAPVVSRPLPS